MMRHFLLFIALTFSLFQANADGWDDLTQKQAQSLVKFLKKNPYIIDYCDCCEGSGATLMKVVSSEIKACSWNAEKWSVVAQVVKLASLDRSETGINEHNAKAMNETESYTVYMNYTFGFNKAGKWATPLFKMVDYDRNHVCSGATNFPQPIVNGNSINVDYEIWYYKAIQNRKRVNANF